MMRVYGKGLTFRAHDLNAQRRRAVFQSVLGTGLDVSPRLVA